MSKDPKPAARLHDFVAHDNSHAWKFLGFLATTATSLAIGAKFIKAPLVFAGPKGWLAIGAISVVEWAVSNFVQDQIDELSKKFADPGIPEIATGSNDTFVNSLKAARGAKMDLVRCHSKVIEQGSEWVTINKAPAARWTDRTACGGAFLTKNPGLIPENVYIGGPPTNYANVAGYHKAAELLMLLFQGPFNGYTKGTGEALDTIVGQGIGKGLDWFTK